MTANQDKKPETTLQKSVESAKTILGYGNPKRATDENAKDVLEGISEFSEIIQSEFNEEDEAKSNQEK